MQMLNRIELIGVVFKCDVQQFGNTKIAKVTLVTQYAGLMADGTPTLENQWHLVYIPQKNSHTSVEDIKKGDWMHVTGRLCYQRYVDKEGNERLMANIHASGAVRLPQDNYEKMDAETSAATVQG